ncbi:DNA topoisomerase IB [Oculatella sp. LEGE 06141]|uniref:DNA topoisomerase IB n=1 Tax=Oculatella sp. LEGE 06141 TaxID=1828648 RepID=UPI00187FBEF0|nr:DNA topoisomerase IB [Oculatella sp. LEGE 06141]MBE9181656.1 DNA topoisomerase IB [Oculatella sp. LEGE 06141]
MQLRVERKVVRRKVKLNLITDPAQSAQRAGLHYVCDDSVGVRRKRSGRGFSYIHADGTRIRDRAELDRIKALAIPPAWENVWICPSPTGHIQATGYDAKGRKQYRYHLDWRKVRDQTKFNRIITFGLALPQIREATDNDLKRQGMPREKILATVVRLLETTRIRIGNAEYAEQNRSFGLTTMRTRHVTVVSNSKVKFKFRGKSGVEHDIELSDRRLTRIIQRCQELPGYELFQYLDEDGKRCAIDSSDVNDYLGDITGEDFTAKDFRTWAGTVEAALALEDMGEATSKTAATRNVSQAIKIVASKLGNRPATCRKYYVHPTIIDAYTEGWLLPTLARRHQWNTDQTSPHDLLPEERAVLAVLEEQLVRDKQKNTP